MAGFFNPNTAFDPNNPQGFDYNEQLRQIQLRQALAQQLNKPLDEGRMVSGWYVAPSKGAAIASALSQALGAYMQVRGVQQQGELDKSDREAMIAARKDYQKASDPSNYVEMARQAVPMPEAQYTYADPGAVGPPQPGAATTYPLRLGQVPSMSDGQGRVPQAIDPALSTGPQVVKGPPKNQIILGAPPAGAMPTSEPQSYDGGGFNVQQPTQEELAAAHQGQLKYIRSAMGDDREAALDRLARTKSGGPLAQAIMARDFAPAEWDFQKVKVGDSEQLIAVNKRDPSQVRTINDVLTAGPSIAERRLQLDIKRDEREERKEQQLLGVKAEDRQRGRTEAIAQNDYALRKIDALLPKVGDATGADGKLSNWFNKVTGIPTDSAAATEELESIKGTLMAAAMRMTKEQSGSAAGLSQVESEALTKSIASLDPRIGQKALTNQLNEVRRQLRMYGDRLSGNEGAPSTAAPTGNFKVPARGQRVTSPEDYGF